MLQKKLHVLDDAKRYYEAILNALYPYGTYIILIFMSMSYLYG